MIKECWSSQAVWWVSHPLILTSQIWSQQKTKYLILEVTRQFSAHACTHICSLIYAKFLWFYYSLYISFILAGKEELGRWSSSTPLVKNPRTVVGDFANNNLYWANNLLREIIVAPIGSNMAGTKFSNRNGEPYHPRDLDIDAQERYIISGNIRMSDNIL